MVPQANPKVCWGCGMRRESQKLTANPLWHSPLSQAPWMHLSMLLLSMCFSYMELRPSKRSNCSPGQLDQLVTSELRLGHLSVVMTMLWLESASSLCPRGFSASFLPPQALFTLLGEELEIQGSNWRTSMPKGGASKVSNHSCPEGCQSPEVLEGQPLCSTPKI